VDVVAGELAGLHSGANRVLQTRLEKRRFTRKDLLDLCKRPYLRR
jgi:hypothetical protein